MSSNQPDHGPINYAKFFGIKSIAAANVFAVLYIPLLVFYIRQSIKQPTYVYIVLAVFCTIRITAFVIREILAASESAGRSLGLFIGDEVLFGVGFFGLLYSAYTLVLDRELLTDAPPPSGIISRLMHNRRLFRIGMIAAIALGISGLSEAQSTDPHTSSTGGTLRKISTILFFVLTVLQAYQTAVLAKMEISDSRTTKRDNENFGMRHGIFILLVVALLLLVREGFAIGTISSLAKQNNEKLWYPLVAVPEILAVILYATPGLVPPRSELPS